MPKNPEKGKSDKEGFTSNEVGALIESFRNDIRVIAEDQASMKDDLSALKNDMREVKEDLAMVKDAVKNSLSALDVRVTGPEAKVK